MAYVLKHLFLFSLLHITAQSDDLDFSYMKSVKPRTDMPSEAEYDYIVIGGGTAGCPLATTLSSRYKVLILEGGGPPTDSPSVLIASTSMGGSDDRHTSPSEIFRSEDGVVNARGRVLGGSSMINFGLYSRGDETFMNESGIEWDTELVEDSYRWVEETVAHETAAPGWQVAVREALLEAGVVPDNGFTLDHELGTKTTASTFDESGRRHGAVQLLNKANMPNLEIVVHAYVDRIIFSSSKTTGLSAKGVKFTDSNGNIHYATIRNKGEIILSAGALGSPQLLLLSGIGPKADLSSHNIPTLNDHPNVGKFVYDNPQNGISFVPPFNLNQSVGLVVGIMKHQIIETISSSTTFNLPTQNGLFPTNSPPINLDFIHIASKIVGPLSDGSLTLTSPNDVKIAPKVRYNYFSNALDLARCAASIRTIGRVLEARPMEEFKVVINSGGGREFKYVGRAMPRNVSDDASMEDFCRETVSTFYHFHGGCVVGKVVDGGLCVKGIDALRVVDGSTFSVSPGTNPQATLMMLGRYMGLKIMKHRLVGECMCPSEEMVCNLKK